MAYSFSHYIPVDYTTQLYCVRTWYCTSKNLDCLLHTWLRLNINLNYGTPYVNNIKSQWYNHAQHSDPIGRNALFVVLALMQNGLKVCRRYTIRCSLYR